MKSATPLTVVITLDIVTPNVELSSVILLLGFFFQSFQSCVFPPQMLIWMYSE